MLFSNNNIFGHGYLIILYNYMLYFILFEISYRDWILNILNYSIIRLLVT